MLYQRRGLLALLLLLTAALEVSAWNASEGYNLADSVEYLQLSESLADDGAIVPSAQRTRSPALPMLLAPLFLAGKALGAEDARAVVVAARLLQMVVSAGLVLIAVRLGERLAGSAGGLVAGFLVAVNPVFLRYCADPLPDLAAGIFLGLAFERLLWSESRARSLAGGLFAGLACVLSYKVIPLVAALGLALLVRDRWRRRESWTGLLAGLAVAALLAVTLDRAIYGVWGLSLANYLVYNAGHVLVSALVKVGLHPLASRIVALGQRYYGVNPELVPAPEELATRIEQPTSAGWYAVHLDELLVVPVLLLALLAVARCFRRPRWPAPALLAILLAYLLVLGNKESRTFRHLLAALPLAAAFCALGWEPLVGSAGAQLRKLRLGAGVAVLCSALLLGIAGFERAGPRAHGHFWEAVDWLERATAAEERTQSFGAEGFPVLYRYPSNLALTPLYRPRPKSGESPEEGLRPLFEPLDWLVISDLALSRPGVLGAANRWFLLEAAFFEPGNSEELGPVHVFRNKRASAEGRALFAIAPAAETERAAALAAFHDSRGDGALQALELLDLRCETLPGSGLWWTTWSWTTETELASDCRIDVRGEATDGTVLFAWSGRPAHGLHPTTRWKPGEVVVEGRLVRESAGGLRAGEPPRIIVSVFELDTDGAQVACWSPGEVEVGRLTCAPATR